MLDDYARLHLNGNLDEAETGYRALLAQQPDNVDAMHMLGVLRRDRRDYAQARQLFDRAHALAPDRADILLDLAGLYMIDGDAVGARSTIDRALKLNPNVPGAHNLLAQIAETDGDSARAESLYRTALRLSEDDPHALGGLGRVLLNRGDIDRGLSYLTAAADRAPKDATLQLYLARALTQKGSAVFAEQAARNAVTLQPTLHAARFLLGQLTLEAGRFDEARTHFTTLLDVPDFAAIAHFGLGDVVRKGGDFEQAITYYRKALSLQPRQVRAVQVLAGSLIALGREREALDVYRQYLADYPDEVAIEASLGDLLMQLDDLGAAQKVWIDLAKRRPGDPTPLQRLAVTHERFGDHAGADAYAAMVAQVTTDPDLILLRARSAQREGRDADALALLETLRPLQLHPLHVGQAAHRFGVLADRRDDVAIAIPAWLESQSMLDARVHEQPPLDPEFLARLAADPAPAPQAKAPVFLVGLPGSMVERVAGLIDLQPGVQLLRDRPTDRPDRQRQDAFTHPVFSSFTADPAQAAQHRDRWLAEATRVGADPANNVVVDWLLRWDARFLPLLQHAFPGATLIVVERKDARDQLLNWLAFGWMPGFPAYDADAAATWLAGAFAHTAVCRQVQGVNVVRVDPDALFADPVANGTALAHALGLAQLVPGPDQFGLGGLPLGLPAGRWEAYQDVLASAFARLQSSR